MKLRKSEYHFISTGVFFDLFECMNERKTETIMANDKELSVIVGKLSDTFFAISLIFIIFAMRKPAVTT